MRAWPSVPLLALVLLAGCAEDVPPAADAVDAPEADGSTAPEVPVVIPNETYTVNWDGNTGTWAYAQEGTSGQGVSQGVVAGTNGFVVERPGMMLVAAELTLTWQAATPASQTLAFELMVMGPNSTLVAEAAGTSGLTLSAQGLAFPLDAETVVHAYFYNPTAFVH